MSQSKKRQWHKAHTKDPFVRAARDQGYRSRAAFKLKQVQECYKILQPGQSVVELGSAPGAWTQYMSTILNKSGQLVACDLLPMDSVKGVTFIQGDFLAHSTQQAIRASLSETCTLIVSDMSPNLTGNRITDQARMSELVESVLAFCEQNLSQDGSLLVKVFNGVEFDTIHDQMKVLFAQVKVIKPEASKRASKEVYLLGQKYQV